jgi:hypothetical protein
VKWLFLLCKDTEVIQTRIHFNLFFFSLFSTTSQTDDNEVMQQFMSLKQKIPAAYCRMWQPSHVFFVS